MSGLSTHVLDTSRGRPAAGVAVLLERREADGWRPLARAVTDADGRVGSLLPEGTALAAGDFRLTFALAEWFAGQGREAFYPEAAVAFTVRDPGEHHHVPLLLSPFGYATYRGS
ncbi:MAG TPA: hydroxyisourate hydrolase [Thermoanaerobaculia bacterium]|nr:hydroxyisourate hydrolase [Thermoanaerobaculia bacterium]